MSAGSDRSHLLRVDEYGEREIVHLPSCPTEEHDFSVCDFEQKYEPMTYTDFACSVGRHVSYWGFDDLTDEKGNEITTLPAGDYPLVLDWYTPESEFEDGEVNFYVKSKPVAPVERTQE